REEDRVVGALIVEQIEDSRPKADFAQTVDLVTQHSSRALANAVDYNSVFLMPLWRTLGKAQWLIQARTLPKTLAVLAGLLVVSAFLAFFPWDFNMRAKGKVLPRVRQEVFAHVDGKVVAVNVKHGDTVAKGATLAVMENPDLTTELARIDGELNEAQEQLRTTQLQLSRGSSLEEGERNQLMLDSIRAKQRVRTLEDQKKLREDEIAHLRITSPMAGQIITWDVEHLLLHRPVARGNLLMTVADPSKDWEVEIFMEEDRMGHIRRNLPADPNQPMDVKYILASNPKLQLKGKLYRSKIQNLAQLHDEHGHSVRLVVEVDPKDLKNALAGTEVTAKVFCGRRSFGYAWFHELIEFLQSHVFF
ncbi:MAG TPA: biotin/lipoyl-binding protein, partial [Pirellulaceae bacterium]